MTGRRVCLSCCIAFSLVPWCEIWMDYLYVMPWISIHHSRSHLPWPLSISLLCRKEEELTKTGLQEICLQSMVLALTSLPLIQKFNPHYLLAVTLERHAVIDISVSWILIFFLSLKLPLGTTSPSLSWQHEFPWSETKIFPLFSSIRHITKCTYSSVHSLFQHSFCRSPSYQHQPDASRW